MIRTAILIDGGFYRKIAQNRWGKKDPRQRAAELINYCQWHLKSNEGTKFETILYRIFYYDCPPISKTIFHPLKGNIDFKKSEEYSWAIDFFSELKKKRKVALRLGRLDDQNAYYTIKQEALKKLCRKVITIDDLTENDFVVSLNQKGVDMKIGLDIASLAHKKQVDQIILISGDSDFVPAAKHARREGIDFILDPMGQHIHDDLFEHIDGLKYRPDCKK
ncbi:MAG: NYN domain-containing protein [Christensenellaceae bacterium]|nr:NYN domain-containing protein [Christensenellaceae bacterium]